jgi:hypothetical protein
VDSATNEVLSVAQGYTDEKISAIPAADFSTNNFELVETIEATAPPPGDYAAVSNAAVHAAITNALQDAAIANKLDKSGGTMTGSVIFSTDPDSSPSTWEDTDFGTSISNDGIRFLDVDNDDSGGTRALITGEYEEGLRIKFYRYNTRGKLLYNKSVRFPLINNSTSETIAYVSSIPVKAVKVDGTALTPDGNGAVDITGKANRAFNPTDGNLAALDEYGNSTDSGLSKDDVESLFFAQYYPDGSVKSAAEFTPNIKYDDPDTTHRTITVKPFCNIDGTATNDNSNLSGRVVIPPFVDASGNPYISDDGTRYKVVGVSGSEQQPSDGGVLTAIVAPDTVTTVGVGAFYDCTALNSVSFPAVVDIENNALSGCTALASVSFPATATIGLYVFSTCTSLASISLPAATTIGAGAFGGCTSLTSVDFGDTPRSSVPTLGINALAGVPTSCKIIVPYTQYDAWTAASDWSSLPQEFVRHAEKADKPATFTTGNLAALDANGNSTDSGLSKDDVESLFFAQYYPEGNVKSAAEFTEGIKYDTPDTTNRTITVKPFCSTGTATNDNSSLVGRVVIPPFVDSGGNGYVSDDGTRYKVVGVSDSDWADPTFNLTAIVAPNTVTSIGGQAFAFCYALTTGSFPSVTTVGIAAFSYCSSLASVSFPAATSIGRSPFYNCTSLASVDFGDTPRSDVPTLGSGAFSGVPTSCKIIVPDAQYDAWTAASGWSSLVTQGYKFLRHSEWEAPHRYETWKMESVTWAQLKAKRDGGTLVPGQQYRITDYVATTSGDMESRSANHPFDIIVVADATNVLNETARAIQHTAATNDYFAACNLAAWEIKYCLDNDTSRFAWALAEGATDPQTGTPGRGVVYRLVDELQNDVPYDFKGLQFKAYGDTVNVWRYTFNDAENLRDSSKSGKVYKNTIGLFRDGQWKLNRIVFMSGSCYSNTFGPDCHSNTFYPDCDHNTFGMNCSYNTFGLDCDYNTFGMNCSYNTVGEFCSYNTLGSGCKYNKFGSTCSGNTLSSYCSYNTFGSVCFGNTLSSYCSYNKFGSDCYYDKFGPSCSYNMLGSDCVANTFGSDCDNNTFGSDCCVGDWRNYDEQYVGMVVYHGNAMRTVLKRYRTWFSTSKTFLVGETLYYDSQYWECVTEHSGPWDAADFRVVQLVGGILSADEYVPLSGYRNVELENGVSYVALDCTANRDDSVYYKNVTVSKGVIGTASAPKHIEDANYSQDYKTTYQPAGSHVIEVQ